MEQGKCEGRSMVEVRGSVVEQCNKSGVKDVELRKGKVTEGTRKQCRCEGRNVVEGARS